VAQEGRAQDGGRHAEPGGRGEEGGGPAQPRAPVVDRLALLDGGLHEPRDQGPGQVGPLRRRPLAAHLDRAQDRGLERRLVLLEVEGHSFVRDAAPQRQHQEARGEPQERHVGEEPEARDGPRLVAEAVHRVGGDAKGE
jgi:hypothetical protein